MKAKQKRRHVEQKQRPIKRQKHKKPAPAPATQAVTVYRRGQLMEPTKTEVELIRSLCAKDANDQEFSIFMRIAKSSRLDPFKKEIYCLVFNKDNPHKRQMVILTGIGGYVAIAAREYPHEFNGFTKPEFEFSGRMTPVSNQPIPDSCTLAVQMKDGTKSWAMVYWDEVIPYGDLKTDERLKFWRNSPRNQLSKCTKGKATRERFPGLNNIYVDAELDRARSEETPQGRKFTIGGKRPDGSEVEARPALDENARSAGNRSAEGEAQLRKVEEADRKFRESKVIDVKPEPENPKAKDIWPKGETEPPKGKKEKKSKTMKELGGELVTGTLHRVLHGTAQNNAPYIEANINRWHFRCYRKTLFGFFDAVADGGHTIECFIANGQIIGLKRIDDTLFDEDGKTRVQA